MSTITPALLPEQMRLISIAESTYGVTPTSGTASVRAIVPPLSFTGTDGMTNVGEVGAPRVNDRDPNDVAQTLLAPTGSASAVVDIENMGWLLDMLFGAPAITAGTGADEGLSQHLYGSGGSPKSHTLQYTLGAEVRRASGVAVESITLPLGKQDGVRKFSAQLIAREVIRNPGGTWNPATTPAALRTPWALPASDATVTLGGVDYPIVEGSLSFANNFDRAHETNGSRFTSDVRGGRTSCTFTMDVILRSQAQFNAFQGAAASSAFVFRFGGSGADKRRLVLTLPRAFVMMPDLEVGDGPARVSLSGEARAPTSGTVPMLAVELWRTTA